MIFKLFRKSAPDTAVYAAYNFIVAQSRQPRFFADWGVPDTVTGRFDMISLHLALVLRRLKADSDAKAFGQALVDLFFRDMDRSLREMGTGDLAVPKKVRKMSELFYGLATSIETALSGSDADVEAVLARNIYGAGHQGAAHLARYLRQEAAAIDSQPVASFLTGAPISGVAA
jgi:cytochrome b pre-mRNA-processing protein 3